MVTALAAMALLRSAAADAGWLTDLSTAQARAKAENKMVLMDFTGSDWCPDCIALKKNVFDTQKFEDYAAANLELVTVDFPDKKAQPRELKKANEKLRDKYNVEAFPGLILLDQNGREIGRLSVNDGASPETFIAAVEKLKPRK